MIEGIQGMSSSSNSGSFSSSSNSEVNKDEFLRLLTYQLKNQNPMNPYDSREFSSQLAQFSQLEQLIDIKSLLEEQVQTNLLLTQTISNTALPGLIGKNAKALSNKLNYDSENDAAATYLLPYKASSGEIIISDENGKIVKRIQITGSQLSSGEHTVYWDGTDDSGAALTKGIYLFEANMKDAAGSSFSADAYSSGKIEAVRFKAEGTMLVINGMEVSLQSVFDISTEE